jgi:regulator of sigma E protease
VNALYARSTAKDYKIIMTTNIFSFIVVLSVLILVHEFGHFLVARLFGVGVLKFSLGFGPRIAGRTIGITDYRLSAIPLGGYVKMVGDEPDAEILPEDIPLSFNHKPLFKRFLIVAAGPFSNLLLAVVIFFGLFLITGIPVLNPVVGKIDSDSPAARAGIQISDIVTAIDGQAIDSWEMMAGTIASSQGRDLTLTLLREGQPLDVVVTPRSKPSKNLFGELVDRYVIGVMSSGDSRIRKLSFVEAMSESMTQTYKIMELTALSIVKLIQGTVSTKTLGGPIMIAEMAGQQAKEGAASLIFFIALLSINLGILNFLPIPVLDGGHLFFFMLEAIIRRPLGIRIQQIAQQVGIAALVLLMIIVFYNDITRIFPRIFQDINLLFSAR